MIGVDQIKKILPHRYPMLLVDRVLDLEPGRRLTAVKAVTCNEPWYRDLAEGSDESQHAYPPVLLVESWCQAAGVLAAWDAPNPDVVEGQVMLFGGMSDICFSGPVLPGDVVEHHIRLVRALSDTLIFEGESVVGTRVVLEIGRVVMALRPGADLVAEVPPLPAEAAAHPNPYATVDLRAEFRSPRHRP